MFWKHTYIGHGLKRCARQFQSTLQKQNLIYPKSRKVMTKTVTTFSLNLLLISLRSKTCIYVSIYMSRHLAQKMREAFRFHVSKYLSISPKSRIHVFDRSDLFVNKKSGPYDLYSYPCIGKVDGQDCRVMLYLYCYKAILSVLAKNTADVKTMLQMR